MEGVLYPSICLRQVSRGALFASSATALPSVTPRRHSCASFVPVDVGAAVVDDPAAVAIVVAAAARVVVVVLLAVVVGIVAARWWSIRYNRRKC